MEEVIYYLELKNKYYEKFLSVTEKFLQQVQADRWDNVEYFVDNRERILNIIRSYDFKIAELFQQVDIGSNRLEAYGERVKEILERRETLGKKIANAEDFPAFIVNRVLVPMINEAIYTLYEGVGSVEAIDKAMRLGAHHPMGPLELADFIGLDTCLSIMQVLYEGLADSKYRPCPLLVKYVEAGWLGRKTNRGFYDYRTDPPTPTR